MSSAPPNCDTDVLIAGAGPTGLVLALSLTRLGVRVRIVDKTESAGTTSRAVAVQARTLGLYTQLGLAETIVEHGQKIVGVNLWVTGRQVAHAIFGPLGAGISPFPYALTFPQDEHEKLLIEHLGRAGVTVERQTEVLSFEEKDEGIVAQLRPVNGTTETCTAKYIAGCDGAHSIVRKVIGAGFPGGVYNHLFYVADVQASGPVMNREIHVGLARTEFLALFPLHGEGRARLVGTVRNFEGRPEELSWEDVSKGVLEWMHINVERVNWFSTYRVHHRVADSFRKSRAFLLGDAAHIHSPVGGQGMNTGIGDAINLAWKLAAVIEGRADASLLDSYEPERIAFARRLVATTDRAFTGVTSPGAMARLVRLHLVPLFMPMLFAFKAVRRFLFRTVSQTAVNYRESSLSVGRAGEVHGGDRLPWVEAEDGGADNFASLTLMDWQVHVYGEASAGIERVCAERKLALRVFPWKSAMRRTGLKRNAVYLVRPDGYVGLVDGAGNPAGIASYLDARGIIAKA